MEDDISISRGAEVELLPKEFAVLEYLISNSSPEAARKVIERLRNKLGTDKNGSTLIETVHRVGYVVRGSTGKSVD